MFIFRLGSSGRGGPILVFEPLQEAVGADGPIAGYGAFGFAQRAAVRKVRPHPGELHAKGCSTPGASHRCGESVHFVFFIELISEAAQHREIRD